MSSASRPLRLAARRPKWAAIPPTAGGAGGAGEAEEASPRARSEVLVLAGAVAVLALIARLLPEARPLLVLPVGLGAFLLGRRSFHLGVAFYFLMLPFLDLLPRQIYGIPALNPRNLMLVALLGILVLQTRRVGPTTQERDGGAVLALAVVVFAWMLLGIPIAYQSHSIPIALSIDTWLNMAAVVVPLLFGVAVARQGARQRRFLAGALLVAVTLVSSWAFITHAAKVAGGGDPTRLRSAGMLGQANSFGAFLALALPGFLTLFASRFRPLARILGAAGTVLCLACLETTLSRGSILAAVAGFVALGLLRHRSLLVGGVVLAIFAGPLLLPSTVSERFSETFVGQEGTEGLDNSAYTRLEMYRAAPQVFRNAPIIGHGLGAYPAAAFRVGGQALARSPHSWYILVASEFGAIGLLLYAAWTLSILLALWRQRSSPSFIGAALSNSLLASTLALAVICFFQKPFVDNELILPCYFAGLGLAIGVGLPVRRGAAAGPRPLAAIPQE